MKEFHKLRNRRRQIDLRRRKLDYGTIGNLLDGNAIDELLER